MNSRLQHVIKYLTGPLLIVLAFFVTRVLEDTPYHLATPAPFLVLIVIYSSFSAGMGAGFLTTLVSIPYMAYFFSESGHFFEYSDTNLHRFSLWLLTLPLIAFFVGLLKSRSELFLKKELTMRKLREDELRNSEDRTRAIINSAYDAFIAIDRHSTIMEWNTQAEKTFGWKRQEVLGKSLADIIIPPPYREAHLRGLAHFNETGEGAIINRRIEVPARHRDGHEISVELTVYPIRQQNSLLFGAFLHDVSARKKNEQLRLLQFNFTQILTEANYLRDAIPLLLKSVSDILHWPCIELWVLEKSQEQLYCFDMYASNEEMEKKFRQLNQNLHIPRQEGLAGSFSEETRPVWLTDLDAVDFPRKKFIREAGIKTFLFCPIHDGPQRIGSLCLFHKSELPPDPLLIELMEDLSKRLGLFILKRWAEENLKQLYKDLESKVQERTQELASLNERLQSEAKEKQVLYDQAQTANRLKDEFLATISHELRTPMNVILGHSELLYENALSEEEQRKSIEAIYRNTKAQVHIVSDILDVSRFITGKLQLHRETIDMAEIISVAVESILPAASAKNIEIFENVDPQVGPIYGDPTRLQQVMWNLLSNAVKFTPRHGKIEVSLENFQSNALVTVHDSGKGIDPNFLPYVFERFRQEDSTTTRKFGGLGLGLAITKNIVEAHGGSIQAHSDGKGKGSTFTVNLPVAAVVKESVIRNKITDAALKEPLKNLRILVVDDQPDAQVLIGTILKKSGADVTVASSVSDAFKILIKLRPDVLISDIGMPEQDGYDLIRMVRRIPKDMGGNTLAIALTAYAHDDDHRRALDSGFQEHLAKPIEAKQLVRTISKLMGRYHPVH